jgi:hypothetical protein
MPGQVIVWALISLYASIGCFMAGGVLMVLGMRVGGALFFGLAGLAGMFWLPLVLVAILLHLSGPPPDAEK